MLMSVLLWLQCQQVPKSSSLKCDYTISIAAVDVRLPYATAVRENPHYKQRYPLACSSVFY